ncbi:MAG: hypothetical protein HN390_03240 [Anaerolineae bacterium]|jgi:cellulose synthase operon protein B|nr:hypothetical protein [Anaerolineae bacterium]MBT7188767.1 hypothetical protein [Anaerolineae bacterium]MBT7600570.1 hypothetical protein [Anaerolineae bacterium]MBT7988748.1 hypothetical protein [Anaerolineae bacterium]
MKTKRSFLFVTILLLLGMLSFYSPQVYAQGTTTPTPTAKVIQQFQTPAPGAEILNFFQIRQNDIQLLGPLDYEAMVFGLPADWEITGTVEITLFIESTVNNLGAATVNGEQVINSGGLLMLEYNREEIGVFPISESGEMMLRVQVPMEFLTQVRQDGRQELTFTFDSGLSCLLEQQMSIVIQDSSYIRIPHGTVLPDTSLAQFPFPLYQNSVYPDTAYVLIPDDPSVEELQSAMTVVAGLSNQTKGNLTMELATFSEFSATETGASNIILVGKTDTIPMLSQLALPLPTTDGKFLFAGSDPEDGIVQMVNSPWDPARVVLVVSGDTDAAVVKASQAISTGHLRPNASPNLSIIRSVRDEAQTVSQNIDQTLLDYGYETEVLDRRGVDSSVFSFIVPSGWTTGPDAYFDLVFGNSALLDYERSGLNVELNGQPVGSVRLTEDTASESVNRAHISLPSSAMTQGVNTLEVIASLQPLDNCSSSQLRGIWANIWSDSRLHLPLVQTSFAPTNTVDLSAYPAPLSFDSSLGSVAFVLQKNNVDSWRLASNIAAYLGDKSNGSITLLKVSYADSISDEIRNNMNLLVVGNALAMPIVSELNESLPAPFDDGSGLATENNMQINFRIPPDSPVGYIELLRSPWNPEKIIIAALGNTPQGLAWAASGLYDTQIRPQLTGNFAVINNQQVTTTDTRLAPPEIAPASPTAEPGVSIIPPTVLPGVEVARPIWLLPALQISLILTLLVGAITIIAAIRRSRNQVETNRRSGDKE